MYPGPQCMHYGSHYTFVFFYLLPIQQFYHYAHIHPNHGHNWSTGADKILRITAKL